MTARIYSPAAGPDDPLVGAPSHAAQARSTLGLSAVPRWKRVLDLVGGGIALAILSPVMAIAAGLVLLSSPGPVLFRQTRIGRNEQPYSMFKFRTMYLAAADDMADREAVARELLGEAVPSADTHLFRPANDPRITPIGRVLRLLSIDELPQLVNVLRGEMSLVGPRPALPWEVDLFTPEQRRRHACLPGITGLWQVSGRGRFSSLEMLELDLTYVDRCSLFLDLAILLRTPKAVLFDRNTR